MRTIGNIIWILCGGLIIALAWVIVGLVLYVTIIGIPLGRQCMKMAALTLAPFGRNVVGGGGLPSLMANILWIVLAGWWIAATYVVAGVLCCCTIVGIPFGLQAFKMAALSFAPFGAVVE